jgi:hypothetical protein
MAKELRPDGVQTLSLAALIVLLGELLGARVFSVNK